MGSFSQLISSRVFPFLLLFIFVVHVGQFIYFHRGQFFTTYSTDYWKDRFEHSQWNLPLSKRIIGDDGLFSYVGYQLWNGKSPSFVNAETPPVGKYLIGSSIGLLNNPAYYALIIGLGSLLLFYFFSKTILHDTSLSLLTVLIVSLDPLIFTQFDKAWIDMTQLFFFLLNIICLSKITNNKKWFWSLGAGVSLGLFAESKPAIFLPIIFFFEVVYLYKRQLLFQIINFVLGMILGIIIPYIYFFIQGRGIVDVIDVHRYMISFYRKSALTSHPEAIWRTLFTGIFPHITSRSSTIIQEWTLLWPIVTLLGILGTIKIIINKKESIYVKGVGLTVFIILIVLSIIPSYPRYLTIALPFLYLLSIKFLYSYFSEKFLKMILVIVCILAFGHAFFYLASPTPKNILQNFYHNYSNQYFQDIYRENLSTISKKNYSQKEFRYIAQTAFNQASIKAIDIREENLIIVGSVGRVLLTIEYKTQNLGSFHEEKTIELVKENNEWKIVWDWNTIFNKYSPEFILETNVVQGKRGEIIDQDGVILAEDIIGKLILINPDEVDPRYEEEIFGYLGKLAYLRPIDVTASFHNSIHENSLPGTWVPIITISQQPRDEIIQTLKAYKGIKIIDHPARVYNRIMPETMRNTLYDECCTRIYSSLNYHGISGEESQYDTILSGYDGGTIRIVDKNEKIIRTLIDKKAKDGEDVRIRSEI